MWISNWQIWKRKKNGNLENNHTLHAVQIISHCHKCNLHQDPWKL